MDLGILPLQIKGALESDPPKSQILRPCTGRKREMATTLTAAAGNSGTPALALIKKLADDCQAPPPTPAQG